MSAQTLEALQSAIAAHLADKEGSDPVLGDFFVAYSCMKSDPSADSGISHGIHYVTSDTAPHAVLGIAHLGLAQLTDDLTPWTDDDEDD